MRRCLYVLAVLIFISGCSSNLQWFNTEKEAINYGMEEEGIKQDEVLGQLKEDGALFVFYKKEFSDGTGVGVANIAHKDGKYAWFRSSSYTVITHSKASWEINDYSGNVYTVHAFKDEKGKINFGIKAGGIQ